MKNIFYVIILILNLGISYLITHLLGINDIVLLKSYSAMGYIITYEVIIWFALNLIIGCIATKKDEV